MRLPYVRKGCRRMRADVEHSGMPGVSILSAAHGEAEREIRKLAERFHVSAKPVRFDRLADTFAHLSDADVETDEVEMLLIHLMRKGALDEKRALDLHAAYLRDMAR